jgi:tRNA G46 methylase TrmB
MIIAERAVQQWLTYSYSNLHLEIGYGSSDVLRKLAYADPGGAYLGVDWNEDWWRFQVRRTADEGLTNVWFINADAREFLPRTVPSCCLRSIHVYFPTPYPRLITARFVTEVYRTLSIGGEFRFVTDLAEYFKDARGAFQSDAWRLVEWRDLGTSEDPSMLVGTHLEWEHGGRFAFRALRVQ